MDKILYNGEIYTLDKNGTKAEAIGIKEGKILMEIRRMVGYRNKKLVLKMH